MWDNDGDFLLIEAAYALPKWLKPETARHRVWLLNGLMHIVPLPTEAAPDLPSFPSLQQAKQIVQGDQVATLAGTFLRSCLSLRLLHQFLAIARTCAAYLHRWHLIVAKIQVVIRSVPSQSRYIDRDCMARTEPNQFVTEKPQCAWDMLIAMLTGHSKFYVKQDIAVLPATPAGSDAFMFAAPKMQQAVAARLKGYPHKAHRQMHKTRVVLPAKVAALLREDPSLAGPAVDAFYNRDVDDMQAAACMSHFSPQV